jgi:Lysylphosphatidylglycerol synthase TM region
VTRWRIALSILLGAGGIAVIAYFLHATRLDDVRDALEQLAAWIPVLLVVEGARIVVEMAGTRALYAPHRLPMGLLLRSHVIGYSLAFYMPAGRATAETVKAAMLVRCATPARAAAVAAANQSLALLGMSAAAFACMIGAACVDGSARLVASVGAVGALTGGLGLTIRFATLRLDAGWLRRFAPKAATVVGDARAEIPRWFPAFPLAMFLANRALQLLSIAILLHVLAGHVTVISTLVAGAVNLVGASLGDMVPGQLGATDATFSVSAGLVGLTPSAAISIALVIHIVQMTWMAIGLVAELAVRVTGWRQGKRVA